MEMENLNLLALNKPETLKKFMNIYSLNTENRIETIKQILKEPNIFHIENINHLKSGNNIKQIIEEMFESIGIKINYEEEK
jgi:F0F1-type ATP synthase delta subunit